MSISSTFFSARCFDYKSFSSSYTSCDCSSEWSRKGSGWLTTVVIDSFNSEVALSLSSSNLDRSTSMSGTSITFFLAARDFFKRRVLLLIELKRSPIYKSISAAKQLSSGRNSIGAIRRDLNSVNSVSEHIYYLFSSSSNSSSLSPKSTFNRFWRSASISDSIELIKLFDESEDSARYSFEILIGVKGLVYAPVSSGVDRRLVLRTVRFLFSVFDAILSKGCCTSIVLA